jgi:protease IV
MAMACSKIVAEALTITGSIGVISGKFSLASLYERVGYSKTTLSRGRCASCTVVPCALAEPDEVRTSQAGCNHCSCTPSICIIAAC